MCAQFTIKIQPNQLRDMLDVPFLSTALTEGVRVLPHQPAPVIVHSPQRGVMVTAMNYSLVPSWSKDKKPKFATYNARIETLMEKPTWREPLLSQHCLVPLTGFFESVYTGPMAGHVIQFSDASDEVLFAAGLYDCWVDPETQQKHFSFAIITTEPDPFILEHGHDRSPIFLDRKAGLKWLTLRGEPSQQIEFLMVTKRLVSFNVHTDRALKSGWESKA